MLGLTRHLRRESLLAGALCQAVAAGLCSLGGGRDVKAQAVKTRLTSADCLGGHHTGKAACTQSHMSVMRLSRWKRGMRMGHL